jgi:hypothetical protein
MACGADFRRMIRENVKRFSEKIMRNNKLKRDGDFIANALWTTRPPNSARKSRFGR